MSFWLTYIHRVTYYRVIRTYINVLRNIWTRSLGVNGLITAWAVSFFKNIDIKMWTLEVSAGKRKLGTKKTRYDITTSRIQTKKIFKNTNFILGLYGEGSRFSVIQGSRTKERKLFSVSPPPQRSKQTPSHRMRTPTLWNIPAPLSNIHVRTTGTILLHAPLADEAARESCGADVLLLADWYTVQLANRKAVSPCNVLYVACRNCSLLLSCHLDPTSDVG